MLTPPTAHLCGMIDKAVLMRLQATFPAMRTTANFLLHREGGIPSGKIILEGNRLRLSVRLKTLDDRHPLRIRAAVCPNIGTRKYKKRNRGTSVPEVIMSRVQRAYRQLPEAEGAETLPPTSYLPKAGSKEEQIEKCKQWINQVPKSEICAYSDGSSEGNGRSAWGFVLKRDGQTLLTGSGIRHGGEALDAEITG